MKPARDAAVGPLHAHLPWFGVSIGVPLGAEPFQCVQKSIGYPGSLLPVPSSARFSCQRTRLRSFARRPPEGCAIERGACHSTSACVVPSRQGQSQQSRQRRRIEFRAPPLFGDRPRPVQVILGGVAPLALGAVVGVVLGVSTEGYW